MKTKLFALSLVVLAALSTNSQLSTCYAQGTAFTYQGRLNIGGTPANGTYDLVFTVFASASGINDAFANQTNSATSVSNGLFTVTLNLGDPHIFTGADRWLEIAVRTNGAGNFTTNAPRQKITPTPYAITAGNLASNGLAGTYANAVTFSNTANSFSGLFFGNGAGLSNVTAVATNAWRLGGNTGTIPGPNFLGTADNQPLEIQVNSTRALRIEPHSGSAPSLIGGYPQNTGSSYHGAVVAGGGTSGSINQALGYYAFVGAGHGSMAADYSAVVAGAYNVASGQLSFIGSGERNTNQANYSFIGGGSNNFLQASATRSFIGGGTLNSNLADIAVIVGGVRNLASGAGAFVGGGGNNTASDFNTVVSGGANNRALANASAIGGGSENTAGGDHSTVGGGQGNTASGNNSTVAGGVNNASSSEYATVGGGWQNTIQTDAIYSTIGGGDFNTIEAESFFSTIGGGTDNRIQTNGTASMIGGGEFNTIEADSFFSTIGGGYDNTIQTNAYDSTIGGGEFNTIQPSADHSTIGGGQGNRIQTAAVLSTIGGGDGNKIYPSADHSTISGGEFNTVQSSANHSTVGGGVTNTIESSAAFSTVAGGTGNTIQLGASYSAIGGGLTNTIQPFAARAAIGGGRGNTIQFSAVSATIGGGNINTIRTNAAFSTIGGGYGNRIETSADTSTIGGGYSNTIQPSAYASTIGGGTFNTNSGPYATVSGGDYNVAGTNSFAAGHRAKANHTGAFVWADSQNADFSSTANNQFNIRAQGGVQLNTDTSLFFGNQTRQMLNLWSTQYGIGVQSYTTYFRTDLGGGFSWFMGGVHTNSQNNPGTGGTEMMRLDANGNLNVRGNVTANSVILTSDRNAKENFKPVNSREVLDKVAALPLARWNFKQDTSTPHLGPMAQDFHAAFGLGTDDKHIATVDADGVALAAIQGLNEKVEVRSEKWEVQHRNSATRLQKLEADNAEMKKQLEEFKQLLVELSAKGN